jgi:hypothetical protein
MIAGTFNNYFLSVAENKNAKINIMMLILVYFQTPLPLSIYCNHLEIPPPPKY